MKVQGSRRWMGYTPAAALGILLAIAGVGNARAHDCSLHEGGGACTRPLADCPDADLTSTSVGIGGEGSVDTEHDCTCSPGSDKFGNMVEADLTYTWDRDSATVGTLTLNVTNTSPAFDPKITKIWFNLPPDIGSCSLVSATVDGQGVTSGWQVLSPGSGEGCLGDFDIELRTTNGIHGSIANGKSGTFVLSCTGTNLDQMDACQIANASTLTNTGERSVTAAMHFQTTDSLGEESDKVSTCAEELFVELGSLEAVADDGRVTLYWTTLLEIDNAGFRVLRHDLVKGEIVELTEGLIPAAGDLFEGASYEFTDGTAVNGVLYEYVLVDVELSGKETWHRGTLAVANPPRAPIRLVAPSYGSGELREGSATTFAWETSSRRPSLLLISTDPTFQDSRRRLTVSAGLSESLTLAPGERARLERLARTQGGIFYWKVIQPTLGSRVLSSPTFQAAYGVLRTTPDRLTPPATTIETTDPLPSRQRPQRRTR